jgi:hypothetical protein
MDVYNAWIIQPGRERKLKRFSHVAGTLRCQFAIRTSVRGTPSKLSPAKYPLLALQVMSTICSSRPLAHATSRQVYARVGLTVIRD